ncbi:MULTISPECIES: hypothetical protein [Klebsiella]|jgi:hypothetical protein|nr:MULTISPECIES: hypothetical protein [Klebsiella]MCW9472306.1 hypothetical protein [Klebsiella grimontii]CAF2876600.1 hypothetical protein AI2943V1_2919 [Klebsiella oxytoca]CAH5711389.1 hypothetical protein AI2943V1_2919 [Klebsiella oxytoca]
MEEFDNNDAPPVTKNFRLPAEENGTGLRVTSSVKKPIKAEHYDN